MKRQSAKKRFAVGAEVRVIMPGMNGVVVEVGNEPAAIGEYWHRIKTKHGERKDPGCNLELIPKPIGGEPATQNEVTRVQLVEYFRSLEKALDEHKQKGTPAGDPVYQNIYEQMASDLALLGIGKDQLEELAIDCGHGTTLSRLEKLRKRPIGF